MKKTFYILSFLFLITGCSDSNDSSDDLSPAEPHFYKGMDLSFQSELETYDVEYKDENGNPINLLDFVSENGTNLVRLKLWNTPQNVQNSLSDIKAYALKIKNKKMDFLLDFHYSDTWADPGPQTPFKHGRTWILIKLKLPFMNIPKTSYSN
ncbi:glycosyl hydrolase 53 family protein [Gelidibacter pelagius]|uniref:Arabinogalactan endo-beta-1,4-galactanase n=1 Tax=Gelidibacter pelagius TaxID=2819985 RepID=A0ABS3SS45_9FLAO|nr:glycosyl hydrolase 53 family protein [Gelidibacter pelagius]MBO3098479.1 glycosyl hydrolase 53 family protein [Gelidibacter pelagius]